MQITERRRIEILLSASLTEEEILDAWHSSSPTGGDTPVAPKKLQEHELDGWRVMLWRARLRHELGSLSAVLDGISICSRNARPLPQWLADASIQYLGYLTPGRDTEQSRTAQRLFKREKTRLARQRRAHLMSKIYHRHAMVARVGEMAWSGLAFAFPERVLLQAEKEGFDLKPERMTLFDAAYATHLCLLSTWATASAETIGRDYRETIDKFARLVDVDDLTQKQIEHLPFDFRDLTEETKSAMGLIDDLPS